MRTFKFRAFDTNRKEMTYFSNLFVGVTEGDWHPAIIGQDMGHWTWDYVDEGDYHIMQGTGLKDMDGNEIYEGDILHALKRKFMGTGLAVDDTLSFEDALFVVDYIQGAFLLQGRRRNKNILMNHLFLNRDYHDARISGSAHYKDEDEGFNIFHRFDNFELAGNIYENPELLAREE